MVIKVLTKASCSCYSGKMDLQENARIQEAIAHHLATGKYASPEDVVLTALQRLNEDEAEYLATVADLRESLADEEAGRVKPLSEVAADIRRKHGFSEVKDLFDDPDLVANLLQ